MTDPRTALLEAAVRDLLTEAHVYLGCCPDSTQPDARDPYCPACVRLMLALGETSEAGR